MTVSEALVFLTRELSVVMGEDSKHEGRLMLSYVLGVEIGRLPLIREHKINDNEHRTLNYMLARRQKREPLQYILGEWEFMGLNFTVRPGALIPRQDTETLVEFALKLAKENGYRTAFDMCCGTGCIGISLAKLGGMTVTASDISPDCVALTKENAAKNGVVLKVSQGSWFDNASGCFDLIVCNPPYIATGEIDGLQQELKYEPMLALDGGADGMDAYRAIKKEFKRFLNPDGRLVMEIGADQKEKVTALFGSETEVIVDFNGLFRVAVVKG